RGVEDRAVREAVALQQEVGLQSVTDGEFRRATWHMDFVYQIGGISKAQGSLLSTFHNEGGDITFTPDAIRVDRRVTMDPTIFGQDFAFLQSVAGDAVPKQTIPAPSMVHYRSGVRAVADESVYPDPEEFWTDLGAAYHIHERYIALTNAAVAGRPADMAITTHLCRGNFRSSWVASGGYDFVA